MEETTVQVDALEPGHHAILVGYGFTLTREEMDQLRTFDVVLRKTSPPDLLVFPEDLAWTFAMTHEAGWYGPYFVDAHR